MSAKPEQRHTYPDEITLKELVLSTAYLFTWLKKHFIKLLFFCLVFGAAGVFWSIGQKETYKANLSFILNDDNNPSISGLAGMLGQLGLPSSGGRYNVDKLLEIAKSRLLVEKTLLQKYSYNGDSDLLANHLIKALELNESWIKKDASYENFRFASNNDSTFQSKERYAIKTLVQIIAGTKSNRANALFATDYGNSDYIMTFSLRSPSEELSIAFVNYHYDNVSDLYVNRAIEKNQEIYNLFLKDRDSLLTLIETTAIEIASLKDRSAGSFRNTTNANIALAEGKLRSLQRAAEEVIVNLGRAQYVLDTNTPLIQLLDRPKSPLNPQKPSVLKYGLAGTVLGICIYLLFLFASLVVKEMGNTHIKNLE